jgi:hypothetical protein
MTEYRTLFESRFKKDNMDYAEEQDYLFMLNAPEQYGVEVEMLNYLKNNSDISVRGMFDYFDKLVPDGTLPIGFDGSDLLEDD